MKWLFGERFCLETKLKPEFVMGLLRDHVGRTHRRPGDGSFDQVPIFDRLVDKEEGYFVLWPSGWLVRNSFRPVWNCKLEKGETGARLRVSARSPGAMAFYILQLGFFGWWGYSVAQGRAPWGQFIGVLGFLAFFLLLSILGFWLPEREAKKSLQRILGGILL